MTNNIINMKLKEEVKEAMANLAIATRIWPM